PGRPPYQPGRGPELPGPPRIRPSPPRARVPGCDALGPLAGGRRGRRPGGHRRRGARVAWPRLRPPDIHGGPQPDRRAGGSSLGQLGSLLPDAVPGGARRPPGAAVKGVRRRRRLRRHRTGALETSLGVAALMAYLLGVDPRLVGLAVGALVALDVAVSVLRGCRCWRRLRTLRGFLALSPA